MSKSANKNRMSLISSEAKKLYDGGNGKVKRWTSAIKQATVNLKKAGKI